MSQRLLISRSPHTDSCYDCVLDGNQKSESEVIKAIEDDFFCRDHRTGTYLGPFKITIDDIDLYKAYESMIKKAFVDIGRRYPDDVWFIYCKGKNIKHPNRNQLKEFIKDNTNGYKRRTS